MLQYLESPEKYGVPSQAVIDFLDACEEEKVEIHSLELRRWDKKFLASTFAPFTERSMHRMYSSGKALCSLAFLFAMQDGLIGLDETLVKVFPDRVPENLPENMDKVTLYHVLTMSTGHERDVFADIKGTDDWVKAFMSIPLTYEPGSKYVYNNGCPHMVSEAVRLRTGIGLDDYLNEKLFGPMGERMHLIANQQGEPEPSSISISIEAFGKIADFLYHHGSYNGVQLLKPELADLMGKRHLPTPIDARVPENYIEKGCNGYGFHTRGNAIGGYKLSGGRNQKAFVLPDYDMTVAIMSNVPREGVVAHLLYTHIIFKMYERPLPENLESFAKLKERLEQLNLGPMGENSSAIEKEVTGKVYKLDANEDGKKTIRFTFEEEKVVMTLDDVELVIGKDGQWVENKPYLLRQPSDFRLNQIPGPKINLYTGVWNGEGEFVFYIRSASRMATDKVYCKFEENKVSVNLYIDPQKNAGSEIEPVVLKGTF